MSKRLAVIAFAMLILVGAIGLKTVARSNGNDVVMTANGGAPPPPWPPPTSW